MADIRRYVPTVAMIAVVVLCVTAGNWQRARMHYKQDLRAQYERARSASPLTAADVPRVTSDWSALRYRDVALRGTFDASRQIMLDNRVHEGQVGYEVVAPLTLDDGRSVLVNRGWIAQGRSRAELPQVPAPRGPVLVKGRIDLPATSYFELKAESLTRPVWQHLDLARYAAWSGLSIPPIIVQQTAPAAATDELVRAWPAPDFGIDTHRIYMVQWYAFAAIALTFWAVTHWPRRRQASGAAADA